jgi:Cd2+/Zn2+-exporting ATPase
MANRGDSTTLAFVGDGNSDEQIMNRVDVGIALGALGSDAALSFADLLIMDRDIKKIPEAIKLSRLCYRTGLLNLLVWFAINAVIIVLSAIGLLPVLAVLIVEVILMFFVLINTGRIN